MLRLARCLTAALFCLTLAAGAQAQQLVPVLTKSFDVNRTGLNPNETVQTPARLRAQSLHLIRTLVMPDDARGTEGQPLIVPGLTMSDGLSHNVLFSATMADDVFAFDVDTGTVIWKQRVGNPIPDTLALDMWMTQGSWGILGTPTINLATRTLYLVDMTSPTGQEGNSQFFLHGLSLLTGVDQFPPVLLNAATYKAPFGRVSTFGAVPRKQRPALLFDSRNGHDTVFICAGSFVEDATTNQGWVIAVDVTGLKARIAATFTTSSRYSGAGIWMAGQGPAMDAGGDVYLITGNGSFDGLTDFGNAFLRLHYTPPASTLVAGQLAPVQWLALFDDTGRVGADPTLADTSLIPAGGYANEPGGTTNMDSPKDQDMGSAGLLLLPEVRTGYSRNVAMGAGKDGILDVLDADHMGNNHPSDFAPAAIAANYAHLLTPPYGFTFYPAGMNLAPTNLAALQTTEFGYSHHQHSTPAFYVSPAIGPELVTGGENGPVRAFTFNKDFSVTYQAAGGDYASANLPPPGGMPGSMISLSANGSTPNTCIIWATQPVGDANKTVTPGYLVAYACDAFANGALEKLYDSRQTAGLTWMFDKFDGPIEWNRTVFVPTYDGRILELQ